MEDRDELGGLALGGLFLGLDAGGDALGGLFLGLDGGGDVLGGADAGGDEDGGEEGGGDEGGDCCCEEQAASHRIAVPPITKCLIRRIKVPGR